jgi:hypothetical protein
MEYPIVYYNLRVKTVVRAPDVGRLRISMQAMSFFGTVATMYLGSRRVKTNRMC